MCYVITFSTPSLRYTSAHVHCVRHERSSNTFESKQVQSRAPFSSMSTTLESGISLFSHWMLLRATCASKTFQESTATHHALFLLLAAANIFSTSGQAHMLNLLLFSQFFKKINLKLDSRVLPALARNYLKSHMCTTEFHADSTHGRANGFKF